MCVKTFGVMVGTPNKILMQREDLFYVVSTFGNCFIHPGVGFQVDHRMVCADGVVRMFNCEYMVDPKSFLMVGKIRLVAE